MSGVLELDALSLYATQPGLCNAATSQTFVLGGGQTLRIEAPRGSMLRVRRGDIWLTQYQDEKDHLLKTSHVLSLNGKGATVITAFLPTVLELYRENAISLRARVERCARVARNRAMRKFLVRLLS